ncbi:MAG: hypothetical protein KatS3mg104_2659 [Phycisphaerae bacterium]|jgi:pSer/pThr/pTyr-binding forkhead associated (FHA) protein|nr:MAG: hypothetical protein KatS3mg104_2659 [Phycisphaerae bacterium]
MNVVLVMFRENGERRSFSLTRDVTLVGRREDADFRIPLSDVSRKHCRLIKDGNQLIVEDLGSANGTFHNGQRVTESEVAPGDTLQFGSIRFIVQIDGVPSEEELLEAASTVAVPPFTPEKTLPESSASSVSRSRRSPVPLTPPPPPPFEDRSVFHEISDESVADEDILIDLNKPDQSEKS